MSDTTQLLGYIRDPEWQRVGSPNPDHDQQHCQLECIGKYWVNNENEKVCDHCGHSPLPENFEQTLWREFTPAQNVNTRDTPLFVLEEDKRPVYEWSGTTRQAGGFEAPYVEGEYSFAENDESLLDDTVGEFESLL